MKNKLVYLIFARPKVSGNPKHLFYMINEKKQLNYTRNFLVKVCLFALLCNFSIAQNNIDSLKRYYKNVAMEPLSLMDTLMIKSLGKFSFSQNTGLLSIPNCKDLKSTKGLFYKNNDTIPYCGYCVVLQSGENVMVNYFDTALYNNRFEDNFNYNHFIHFSSSHVKIISSYKNGKRDGKRLYYDKKGQLIKTEVYKLGKLNISENSSNKSALLQQSQFYDKQGRLLADSSFSISKSQLKKWLKIEDSISKLILKNLIYPDMLYENHYDGQLIVSFSVNKDGSFDTIALEKFKSSNSADTSKLPAHIRMFNKHCTEVIKGYSKQFAKLGFMATEKPEKYFLVFDFSIQKDLGIKLKKSIKKGMICMEADYFLEVIRPPVH